MVRMAPRFRAPHSGASGPGATSGALPQDAYDKIRAGASLVQLYTMLAYHGCQTRHHAPRARTHAPRGYACRLV